MNQAIKVRRRAFSVVPDDILADERLSWRARVLLAWMLGRSPDFDLRIWYIRKVFRISQQQWVKARKEMQAVGYFQQERIQGEKGRLQWVHFVTDSPAPPSPQKPPNGKPSDSEQSDGPPTYGKSGGKPI
ncbi:hypothetical protein [Halopseudomonas pelagia]|uniref:hypothetical protein n=1 Tax=Halopseudomonas pelagia TaxID=553151 RepID=UPI0003B5A65D|nr:hypothetical protein [Halopseudomonas pelagia]